MFNSPLLSSIFVYDISAEVEVLRNVPLKVLDNFLIMKIVATTRISTYDNEIYEHLMKVKMGYTYVRLWIGLTQDTAESEGLLRMCGRQLLFKIYFPMVNVIFSLSGILPNHNIIV